MKQYGLLLLVSLTFLFCIFVQRAESASQVTISSPANNAHINQGSTISVSGTYSWDQNLDSNGGTISFLVGTTLMSSQSADLSAGSHSFSFSWDTTGYQDSYTLTVKLSNSSGNYVSGSVSVVVVYLHDISISPKNVNKVFCGHEYASFTVTGHDQLGNAFPLTTSQIEWSTDCGDMSPDSGSNSSKLEAGTFPKEGTVYVDYNEFEDSATVRVYPQFGDFTIRGERDWVVFPVTFKIHGYVERLADSYGVWWGFSWPAPWFKWTYCWEDYGWSEQPATSKWDLLFPRTCIVGLGQTGLGCAVYYYYDDGGMGPSKSADNQPLMFWW